MNSNNSELKTQNSKPIHPVKTIIFAAGLGTRLKPITDTMPKAMVEVAGKPLLWHTIQKLKAAGINEVIINTHHFAEQIVDYVHANNNFGIRIEFSDEREQLLDTGGGIKKASWFFDDGKPFLIHNVDILSNIDIPLLFKKHQQSNAIATLVVNKRETSRYFLFDENNKLHGWINTKTGETKSPHPHFCADNYRKLAFNGIHIVEPKAFDYMNELPDKFSIIDFYLSICNKKNIIAYEPENLTVIDVGKPESLEKAARFLQQI